MKKVLFNILGIIAGYITGVLGYLLCYFLFFGIIGNIPIIRSILSYPVDFEEYALIGTMYGTVIFGIVAILFGILGQSFSKLSKIALLVIGIIIAYLENIGIFIF